MLLTILTSERIQSLCARRTFHTLQTHMNLTVEMHAARSKHCPQLLRVAQ